MAGYGYWKAEEGARGRTQVAVYTPGKMTIGLERDSIQFEWVAGGLTVYNSNGWPSGVPGVYRSTGHVSC